MKKFFTDIVKIQEAIKNRKLVVFAGAGISADAGVPLWGSLVKQLAGEIDISEREEDALRIAQMYYNERQSKEYVEKIRQILKHKQVRYNEIHEAILKLRPEHILTTNYDDLLDQAIQAGAYPFSIVSRDNQFPYSRNVSLLVKIHGDLEDDNFVLKEDDYLEYATRYPLIEAFIKSVFTSKVVLFVGYSFSDPNLKVILQTVRNILGQHYQNAYLLSTDEQLHSSQREYLKQKGVIAINYTDADTEERKFIDDYLKGKNAVKKKSKIEGQRLSSHGQKLLDFLRFINVYNPFIEALSQKNIVLQQYESLKRFEELPVLTADFIANLYPFNTSDQRIHSLESYVLESTNDELTGFYFQSAQKQENDEDSTSPRYRPNSESETYDKELYVIKKLRSAFVEYIRKKNGGRVRIQSSEDISECECFRCLFYNLRWGDLIERVDRYEVTTTSLLGEDTLAAYANYKLSNYKKAIQQFEKIALKAWRTDKTSTYFLATQNIKHLQRLGFWEKIETDKISESDIEQVFHQLHNVDDDQRELLKIIKENKVVHRAE